MTYSKKTFFICAALWAGMLAVCAWASGAWAFSMALSGSRLSLSASNEPLRQILQQFADSGVVVHIDPSINPRVSALFQKRDLQSALKSLLRGLNHTLVWKSGPGRSRRGGLLAEIQIFDPGNKGNMKLLASHKKRNIGVDVKTGAMFVKGQILVRFAPGISWQTAQKILAAIGGTLADGDPLTGVYLVRLPENADVAAIQDFLAHTPGIAAAEPDYVYAIPPPGTRTSQVLDLNSLSYMSAGDGSVPVAILDSGLDLSAVWGANVIAALDAVNSGGAMDDPLGHGTQMALIASGEIKPEGAKDAYSLDNPIIAIRAFDEEGLTSNYTIMKSITYALENGARVINMSWGSDMGSVFLSDTLEQAASMGAVLVAAAGNEPTTDNIYPAAYDSVIAVGALTPDGLAWDSSSQGSYVALSAPGFADLPVGYGAEAGTYAGTSISAAYVSAIIASELSKNPYATKAELYAAIKKYY